MSFLNGLADDINNAASDVENFGSQALNTVENTGGQVLNTVESTGGQVLGDVESAATNPTVDEVAGDVGKAAAAVAPLLP